MEIKNSIKEYIETSADRIEAIEEIKMLLHELSPIKSQPVNLVRWVPVDKIQANDYNPNKVANTEMRLLYVSIFQDGYTQPIVTIYDPNIDKYIIVDGFHRYFVGKNNKDILERNHGRLPVVVIDKDINERMASTIRHNRARGKHTIQGMSNTVFKMLDNGWSDARICNELGMEPEELAKLKHITGFSKLFKDIEYRRAWETRRQIQIRKEYEENHPEEVKKN